jgi:hypothetical protein
VVDVVTAVSGLEAEASARLLAGASASRTAFVLMRLAARNHGLAARILACFASRAAAYTELSRVCESPHANSLPHAIYISRG